MKIRKKVISSHEAHRLTSWDSNIWPAWLRDSDSVAWITKWRGKGWLRLGDVVYMQGKTLASGLGVMDDNWEEV